MNAQPPNKSAILDSSMVSSDALLGEQLNLQFNTSIFSQDCEYIYELGNIYSAKAQIDMALSEIMPQMKIQSRVAHYVKILFESLDQLKVATKKCVDNMEEQRKDMYKVA